MRKLYSLLTSKLLIVFTFCAFSFNLSAQTVQIGTGTVASYHPFNQYYWYGRGVTIYPASAIARYGTITKLEWDVSSAVADLTPVKIYLVTTTATSLTASAFSSYLTGATLVYDANVNFSVTGWKSFNLTTPFAYTTGNLMVITEANIGNLCSCYLTTYAQFNGTTGTTSTFEYWMQDASPPTGNGTVTTTIPNIKITFMAAGLDASISSMPKPSFPAVPGIDTVKATLSNWGNTTITSATLGWSVDGNIQTPYAWTGNLVSYTTAPATTLGTFNFSNGLHNIKTWVSNPNGSADVFAANDTFYASIMFCSPMAGNYSIGAAPSDFPTISSALTALAGCGIAGPVNFTVKPGTYTGRIVISPIQGASNTNRITFNGRFADSVKIIYAGASPNAATLAFNGADFFTFKNITIQNTGTAYGVGTWFGAGADYNTIDSCKIIVDTVGTASYVIPVVSSSSETSYSGAGNNSNYTTISNCLLKGGYYGATFYGSSTTSKCTNNSVINCLFSKQYYYGIYSYYQTNPSFIKNTIASFRNTTGSYGIYSYYNDNPEIVGNYINAFVYGLYHYYCTSSNIANNYIQAGYMGMYVYQLTNPVDSATIINNMVRASGNSSYSYSNGLYLYYSAKVSVFHNTFQVDTTYSSPTGYGAAQIRYASGPIIVKNNIFRSLGNLPCFNTDGANIATDKLDYNDYYTATAGNIIAYWGTTSYTSFNAWKSAMPNYNKNSVSKDPQLVSKYDFHLKPTAPFLRGTIVNIPKDYDNNNRCLSSPTMGADEYNHPYQTLKADFFIDSFVCLNSPYTFINKAGANEPKLHFWYLNGVFQTNAMNFSYKFTTPGIDTVRLVSQNCSTKDTLTKIFTVQLPTSAPVSTFIANKNLLEVYEDVSFIDLSSNCPERWKWSIYPDSIDDPLLGYRTPTYAFTSGKDTTQFPKLTFLYSGKYTICLTTFNSIDTGTTYCINNYIEVKPSSMLCIYPFDTKENYGTLYDEGGYLGAYYPNKTCGFLIHPCASSVRLVFKYFDIAAGDYMRIFDGPDNKSRPLWNTVLYQTGFNNGTYVPGLADTFVGTSGKLYIELATDAATQNNGFIANWTSDKESYTPPDASFDVADTVCNGVPTFFHNTSTGTQNDSYWDFDNDNYTDDNTTDGVYKYQWDGPYTVKLTVSGCGGTDTISHNIIVHTPIASPQFEIVADNYKPNIFNEVVNITENTLLNCVDSVIWDISPKQYTIVSGKLQNSYSLGMKFNDTVCYDFRVIGIYNGMSDTVFYPCFIKPLLFCKPVASNISPDIGISRVAINTIDNYSDVGLTEYTDYSNSILTELEMGARYDITLERKTNFNPISRKVWIDYNMDGYFDDKTELAAYDSNSNSLNWTGMISLPNNIDYITTRMRIGTSLAGSKNSSCGPNYFGEFEDYKVRFIPDKTKPIISLIGATMLHVVECSPAFVDPGFIAYDNVNTHMADSVIVSGTVNPSVPGIYEIKYNLKDAAGNVADELVRTVIVDKESAPPTFALIGPLTETIQVFSTWYDSGYVVSDTCSGLDIVIVNNSLDTAKLGTYSVSYQAYDISGNVAKASRSITVIDNIAPVIMSISNDTIKLRVYHLLPNPLYSITDNYYANVDVVIKGTYYENFPNGEATSLGNYTFKYIATDGSGNSDSISFIIQVIDDVKPVIQLNGYVYYELCRFDTLDDPGYIVKDNYDKNTKVSKSGSYVTDYLVNRRVGTYELIYTASDNSNNQSVETRSIFVTDQGNCFNSVSSSAIINGIYMYPNPGNGKFNIEFNISKAQLTEITVYDAIGNAIYQNEEIIKPGQIKTFDYFDMKPGMYIIRIAQDEKITTLKYNLMR